MVAEDEGQQLDANEVDYEVIIVSGSLFLEMPFLSAFSYLRLHGRESLSEFGHSVSVPSSRAPWTRSVPEFSPFCGHLVLH